MIKRLEITAVHLEAGADLKKYVASKIGNLDNYVSRHARQSLHAEVKLKQSKAKNKLTHTCEVILHLPGDKLTFTETAQNIFEAIDIAEEKLKMQLKKYKDLHTNSRLHQRILARLKRTQNPLA